MNEEPKRLLGTGAQALLQKLEEGFRVVPGMNWNEWTIRKDGTVYRVDAAWLRELTEGFYVAWNYGEIQAMDLVRIVPQDKT